MALSAEVPLRSSSTAFCCTAMMLSKGARRLNISPAMRWYDRPVSVGAVSSCEEQAGRKDSETIERIIYCSFFIADCKIWLDTGGISAGADAHFRHCAKLTNNNQTKKSGVRSEKSLISLVLYP